MASRIRKYHVERYAIEGDKHIIPGSVGSEQFKSDELKICEVQVLTGGKLSVPADAVAIVNFTHSVLRLSARSLENVKSAKLVLSYTWPDVGAGTFEFFNETDGVVILATPSITGPATEEWAEFSVDPADLAADKTLRMRANITTAAAAGTTVDLYKAMLLLFRGYS